MKFSGKMCLKIVLKVTTNQGFTISLEDTFFRNTTGGGQTDPLTVLGLKRYTMLYLKSLTFLFIALGI